MAKKSSDHSPMSDIVNSEATASPANGPIGGGHMSAMSDHPATATLAEPARGVPGVGKQTLPDLAEVARQHVLNTTATVATPSSEIAAPRASQTPSQRPRGLDVELQIMAKVDKMLAELEDDPKAGLPAVGRVLDWIKSRWQTRPCTEKSDINVSNR